LAGGYEQTQPAKETMNFTDTEPISNDTSLSSEVEYVGTGDARFGFRRLGPRGAPPLLMCHRFRGTIDDWDPAFLALLAAKRDVIVFDNLGVGYSTGSVPNSVSLMAEAALDFADLLELETFDALGWSMGGFVAQALALLAPERVRRLVIAASKPGLVPDVPPTPQRASQVVGKPVNDHEDFLYLFFPASPAGRTEGERSLDRLILDEAHTRVSLSAEGAAAQTEALIAWSRGEETAWERSSEFSMPVLIGHGAQDVLMHPYNAYAFASRLDAAKLVLYGDAGHAFLFQHAEDFARETLEFLR
jgi:pimeloyl-ACP methyl ester carboxylesterase